MDQLKMYFRQLPFWWALRMSLLHFVRILFTKNYGLSFAQSGEDRILTHLIDVSKSGFYIDIGANEPITLSNTFLLYSKGWTGITIDASKEMMDKHKRIRIKDTAICAALSKDFGTKKFYQYEDSAYNTFDKKIADHLIGKFKVKEFTVETVPLNSILEKHKGIIPDRIDLLSIDVEGMDFEIIQSLNFDLFVPELIVIEMHGFSLENKAENAVYNLLISKGYELIGFVAMNGYFRKVAYVSSIDMKKS